MTSTNRIIFDDWKVRETNCFKSRKRDYFVLLIMTSFFSILSLVISFIFYYCFILSVLLLVALICIYLEWLKIKNNHLIISTDSIIIYNRFKKPILYHYDTNKTKIKVRQSVKRGGGIFLSFIGKDNKLICKYEDMINVPSTYQQHKTKWEEAIASLGLKIIDPTEVFKNTIECKFDDENLNKFDRTKNYYKYLETCNCGDCVFFINNIRETLPEVCEYLESLGIDPEKPYELFPYIDEKEKKINYTNCIYAVIADINKDFNKEINKRNITYFSPDMLPTEKNKNVKFIDIGCIELNYTFKKPRTFTSDDLVKIVKEVIDRNDLEELLAIVCPNDEYKTEIEMIASSIKDNHLEWKKVKEVFLHQFDAKYDDKQYKRIAEQINIQLNVEDYY